MSRDASVTLAWADGDHIFRLAIGQLRELQEKCDAGPPVILTRLSTNAWRVDDVREAIRIGLIGGGMSPATALSLVTRYVDERPLIESVATAQAILLAAIVGVGDETDDDSTVGKKAEAEATQTATNEDASLSPQSMEQAPSSASPPATSTS